MTSPSHTADPSHRAGASKVVAPAKLKLAERIAMRLGQHIARQKLQTGDPLGNENDLVEQFQASRWTIRQAISILRREGQVEIRRGRLGGYFVAQVDAAPLSGAIRTYLEFLNVGIDEILEARRILDELVLRLAIERVTLADIAQLRSKRERYQVMLSVTRSPVAQIFARSARRYEIIALLRSSLTKADYTAIMAEFGEARAGQAEAVIAGDFVGAWRHECQILDRSAEVFNRCFEPAPDMNPARFRERVESFMGDRIARKPEMLIYQLGADIVSRGWPVDCHLGSEPELLMRYGIGRSAFREAVRPLEHVGLVTMKTGRNSGLKVGSPSLEKVIAASLAQFARLHAPLGSYFETMRALIIGAVGIAAGRDARIEVPVDADSATFFEAIGDATGNRVIMTMIRILSAQLPAIAHCQGDGTSKWKAGASIRQQMLSSMNDGDVASARRAAILLCSDVYPWLPAPTADK